MKIAVLRETQTGESRVAATPETITKLVALGAETAVETGAGLGARFADADYSAAGATTGGRQTILAGADIVLCVRRPAAADLAGAAKGALLVGGLDPYGHESEIAALAQAGLTAIAMEFMPRITRAQVMDILSSQANLAGYQAVIEAAALFERAMPMMMTAAGTVRPAKVFVMGAGVAGLQAIATARRLGAVVSATDVRAAAGEQVESLGAKFIMTDTLKDASGTGGYARELTASEQAAQADLVAGHIAKQDIVVTTALIPGRPAPRLVSTAMVEAMAAGSVIIDLAAERGGNVELTRADEIIDHKGVKIVGFTNLSSRVATSASQLYARNLLAFLETLIDKKDKRLAIDWQDELLKATVLTRDGALVHPAFAPPGAQKSTAQQSTSPSDGPENAGENPAPKRRGKPAAEKPARAKTGRTKSTGTRSTGARSTEPKQTRTRKKTVASAADPQTSEAQTSDIDAPAAKPTRKRAARKPAEDSAPVTPKKGQ